MPRLHSHLVPWFDRRWPRAAAWVGLAFVLAAGGCQSGPAPAREFVEQAERFHQQALGSTVVRTGDVNEYMQEMGRRIIQGAADATGGRFRDPVFANMQFHLVASPVPNAYTTGGSHIYLTEGLFQLCRSEEALAGVMAHEFAHAVDLDLQQTGMRPDANSTLDQVAYSFVQYPLAPDVELEADARGFLFHARGGWDPARYTEVYDSLLRTRRDGAFEVTAGRGAPNLRAPTLAARKAAADALIRSLPNESRNWRKAAVADPTTFAQIQSQARTNPSGERATPQNAAWLYLRALPNCLLPGDLPEQKQAQERLRQLTTPILQPRLPEPS